MEKLLIADTSTVFSETLTRALKNYYEVYSCTTGDEALHLVETLQPRVLIINLMLPYMDGLQVLRISQYKPPVILALTTNATNYVLQAVQDAGVDFVVMLPCTIQSMVSHVREITRLKKERKDMSVPQQLAEAHLLRLGLPAHWAGFARLKVGIPLFMQDENQSLNKELYPAIAELCGNDNALQVERSIRIAIEKAWKNRDPQVWLEYFPESTEPPTNKMFLVALAQKLRRSDPNRIW